jgi:mercuric ion binding protein
MLELPKRRFPMKKQMKLFSAALAVALGAAAVAPVIAADAKPTQSAPANSQVATFAVAKMTCGSCPIIVNKAMSAVQGVRSVKIDAERKTATVQFDPKVTNIAAIAAASANAGYPARPIG